MTAGVKLESDAPAQERDLGCLKNLAYLSRLGRADERTRTADPHIPHLLSGEQVISSAATNQETQDGSSLLGKVRDPLRSVHL